MHQNETLYRTLIQRLAAVRRYDIAITSVRGMVLLLLVFGCFTGFALIVNTIFPLPSLLRYLYLGLTLSGVSYALITFLVRPLLQNRSLERIALRVEHHFPTLGNNVINALQLWRVRQAESNPYSSALLDAAFQRSVHATENVDFKRIVNTQSLWKYGRYLSAVLVFLLIFGAVFPHQFRQSWALFLNPALQPDQKPQPQILRVLPGNAEVVRGASVPVSAEIGNVVPATVSVRYGRTPATLKNQLELASEDDRLFSGTIEGVERSFFYTVQADHVTSPIYQVTVNEFPLVTGIKLEYFYPAYTGIPEKVVEENNGDITAIKGTMVWVTVTSNNPLRRAALVFANGEQLAMKLQTARSAKRQILITEETSYHIELMDYLNAESVNPVQYKINVLEDEYPVVRIIEPEQDIDLTNDLRLPVWISAADDYGIRHINLKYKLNDDGQEQMMPLTDGQAKTEVSHQFTWDLNEFMLLPEDVIIYYVEVYDNDTVSGPKRSVSPTYTARVPSLMEIYDEVAEQQDDQIDDAEEILEESRDIKEQLDDVARELLKNPDMTYEQKKSVENALKKQQELAQKVEELSKSLEETVEKLEQNEAATLEMLEKMEEVQQLMEEIATDEMKEAMEKLQEAMQELDPNEIQKAMENMSLTQEEYMERLERTLGLLKQIQMEQKMDAAVQKAQELTRQQNEVNEGTQEAEKNGDQNQLDELAQDQERIAEETDALQKELEELAQMMQENGLSDLAQQMQQLAQQMQHQQLSGQMQQSSQQMQQGEPQEAQQTQQEIMRQLLDLSEQLQDMQQQMQMQSMQQMMAGLQDAIRDLLHISDEEENLGNEIQRLQGRTYDTYTDLADWQQILRNGTARVTDEIFEMSKKSMMISPAIGKHLGEALDKMDETQNQLVERRGRNAITFVREATASVNAAIIELMKSAENMQQQMQGGQSASGMQQLMQQLQNMAGQQQQIGEGMQGLQQMMGQDGQLSAEARAAMARLAAEQEAVKKSVEELAKEMAEHGDILGRIDDLAGEMDEIMKDLQQQNIDQETLDRQQKIMTRLLDTQRSLRKQDYSKRRKSKTGQQVERTSPPVLPPDKGEPKSTLREDLLRAIQEGYPPQYEELIKSYFRTLSGEY
ncbi:MAG: hypothetical protein D6675_03740 [Gemmatimonadetes bacterium]|nr:MAG: hypothetical protein D6675_03740 [Gemmatimonadota bacterium]